METAEVLASLAQFVPVIFLSMVAFWRPNAVLFMLAAGASLITGFSWYDTYMTNAGLTISLMLIGYSFACLGFAFRCLFWREGKQ